MNTSFFIASSKELAHERLIVGDALMDVLRRETAENYIKIVKWEYLDSDFGQKEKQAEYDDHLRQCDITIVLFWKKLGIYTDREYQIAKELEQMGKHCFVLFKNVDLALREEKLKQFYEAVKEEYTTFCFSSDKELYGIIFRIASSHLSKQ